MGIRPLADFKKNNAKLDLEEEEKDDNQQQREEEQEKQTLTPEEAVDNWKKDYATKLGWTTQEEWVAKGKDPAFWRDHNSFVDNTPTFVEKVRKTNKDLSHRMERNAAAAAAAIEEERTRAREEAKREAREAAAAGDADKAAAAVDRATQATVAPETEAWIKRNSWFAEDAEAQAVAVATVNRLARSGASIEEQLEAAENTVKKRFPELFEEPIDDLPEFIRKQPITRKEEVTEEPKKEVKMSESTKVAAAANNSNNSSRNRDTKSSKEKGFNEIPEADKQLYDKYFSRKFQSHGLSVEAAREKYAKTYWNNKG